MPEKDTRRRKQPGRAQAETARIERESRAAVEEMLANRGRGRFFDRVQPPRPRAVPGEITDTMAQRGRGVVNPELTREPPISLRGRSESPPTPRPRRTRAVTPAVSAPEPLPRVTTPYVPPITTTPKIVDRTNRPRPRRK